LHVSAPKGKLPADLRAQIAEHKADILTLLHQRSSTKRAAAPPIKSRASNELAPLSFAQERLWFLEQLEPQSVAYNICRAFRLLGNLNPSALEASLNEIISRHETLRTAFRLVDGRPVQVVQPFRNISIEYVDLQGRPDDERDSEIQRRIKGESEHPFDLSAGSLLRSTLLRAGDQEHVLILMTHHSASDAWSMGILTRELWTLYEAFSNGKPSPFERLPVQYSDYAVWQRNWVQGEVLDTQLAYWKKHLQNLSIINLPTDRPRKSRQSFDGRRAPIALPENLTSAVNETSHRFGVTPFMTLLAAFQVLLYRYTGQEDVVVGSPIANRRRPEVEGLIGFFVNTLVLRADLSGSPSFKELLSRVKDTCVAADANQDLPFEKLVQELQPERDQSRNPLFQVMFVLQNATPPFTGIPGLRIEPLEVATTRSPFDLSLFLRERDGKYIGYIEYRTDLFDRDRIERMAGHFQTLLEAIVADPEQPIAMLPIITDAERHQILVEWNNTVADYPKDKCIHQLFEEQAERTPDELALEFEEKQITYRELNRKANQLAHYLVSLGIGPEKLVGISIDRSIEIVVALLGILKAGGAYLPLDPAYPNERLRFMMEDAQVSVLLTHAKLVEDRGWRMEDSDPQSSIINPHLEVVYLDRDWPIIEQQRTENPNSRNDSESLAYVIYTSGSTGQPKGVAIEHRNTVNLLYWAKSIYGSSELAGVFASTSICFDLSVFELFVPLSWGGKIILAENALSLRDAVNKRITLVNTVPSAMAALFTAGVLPESIRAVNLAGEPLRPDLVNQLYQTGTIEKVYDLYGPSETTTYSTFTRRVGNGPATIGRPIANTHIYLLDSQLQPVPIGVTGEIYVGGAGVVRGYQNQPVLTKEKFISDPFSDDGVSRLYRTGDLARYLPDGNIEFLGRADNQVKIRGYRIELGEIERVLNQHPAVSDSVIVARDRGSLGDNELIGYVVSTEEPRTSVSELRGFLSGKLPEYMIPSSFVFLDDLPLSPNGKLDLSKFPQPEESLRDLNAVPIPLRSELEELIAGIWRDVLKTENIGVHDNFFALGGHSLLAIQIIARLQEAFNKDVPLRILFDAPTIEKLRHELETLIRDGHAPELPPIDRAPRDGPLPLSMNQEHLWRLDRLIPGTHFFNMPYIYQLSGPLNVVALEKSLKEIINRHEALRTVFATLEGYPIQIIKHSPEFQLPVIDLRNPLSVNLEEQAASIILEEREQPFDLAEGPLLRVKLLRLTDADYLLLLTLHHIISDQASMQLFRSELAVLYESFSHGNPSPLPDPPFQFADYAFWERSVLKQGLIDSQLSFWKRQLATPLAPLEFRTFDKREKKLRLRTSCQTVELEETLFQELKTLARQETFTPCMILITALAILLYRQTGQTDIRIGIIVANRGRKQTDRVIGHFVNTVILRTIISPDMTYRQILKRVKEASLAAYTHQEFSFEHLASLIEQGPKIDRESLFNVLVNYQSRSVDPVEIPGLTFAPLYWKHAGAVQNVTFTTFDLILNLREASTKLTGTVNYNADISNDAIIAGMMKCFNQILQNIIRDPAQPITTTTIGE